MEEIRPAEIGKNRAVVPIEDAEESLVLQYTITPENIVGFLVHRIRERRGERAIRRDLMAGIGGFPTEVSFTEKELLRASQRLHGLHLEEKTGAGFIATGNVIQYRINQYFEGQRRSQE